MVGIITIDGKVDDAELPYLQKAMELVESQELKEKLLSVARLERKVPSPFNSVGWGTGV